MAKIDFFRIEVFDKQTGDSRKVNLSKLITKQLSDMSYLDKYCKHRSCDATMAEYIENDNSTTFDFIKFTQEIIHSTIISEPEKETDTFKSLNNHLIEKAKYLKKDIEVVRKIIKRHTNSVLEMKNNLEKTHIDKFSIYKIIVDEKLDNTDDEHTLSNLFYTSNLERLKKVKTYFNLTYYLDNNLLLIQKVSDGFDYKKLNEYINLYILKDTEYKIKIQYIYDNGFLDILEHSALTQFKFSFDLRTNSLLDKEGFTNPFKQIFSTMGKQKITISADADKNEELDNQSLVSFYMSAKESGLLESAKLKKKGSQKLIDSLSKGDYLTYSSRDRIEKILDANEIFLIAFLDREEIIKDKIWI